jgi:hypothetical protein
VLKTLLNVCSQLCLSSLLPGLLYGTQAYLQGVELSGGLRVSRKEEKICASLFVQQALLLFERVVSSMWCGGLQGPSVELLHCWMLSSCRCTCKVRVGKVCVEAA